MAKLPIPETVREKAYDIQAEIPYRILRETTKTEKPVSTSVKNKLLWAGLSGIASLAATAAIPRVIMRTRVPVPVLLGGATTGAMLGYLAPSLQNVILEGRRGDVTEARARKVFKEAYNIPDKALAKLTQAAREAKEMSKQSGLISGAGKVVGGFAGAVGRSLLPSRLGGFARTAPIGVKAFKWGVRGAAGVGAVAGGTRLWRATTGPRSGANYITMLRNNILAGKIRPEELSPADMAAVQRLGLR